MWYFSKFPNELKLREANQKILLCTVNKEFSGLVSPGQMSDEEQKERWELFMNHVKRQARKDTFLYKNKVTIIVCALMQYNVSSQQVNKY